MQLPIANIQNTKVRRAIIVLLVAIFIPLLVAIVVAEVLWETLKVMVKIIKEQIQDTTPKFQAIIEQIKEVW